MVVAGIGMIAVPGLQGAGAGLLYGMTILDVTSAATGKDWLTQRKLSPGERVLNVVTAIPVTKVAGFSLKGVKESAKAVAKATTTGIKNTTKNVISSIKSTPKPVPAPAPTSSDSGGLKMDLQMFANKNLSKEQILESVSSYEQARNKDLNIVGDLDQGGKPLIGRLPSSQGQGQIIGRQSLDGKIRWRLDYDPIKGTHINIEDFTSGKGDLSKKTVIPFTGDEEAFKALLKHLNN